MDKRTIERMAEAAGFNPMEIKTNLAGEIIALAFLAYAKGQSDAMKEQDTKGEK